MGIRMVRGDITTQPVDAVTASQHALELSEVRFVLFSDEALEAFSAALAGLTPG
jgi:hypothetical protein